MTRGLLMSHVDPGSHRKGPYLCRRLCGGRGRKAKGDTPHSTTSTASTSISSSSRIDTENIMGHVMICNHVSNNGSSIQKGTGYMSSGMAAIIQGGRRTRLNTTTGVMTVSHSAFDADLAATAVKSQANPPWTANPSWIDTWMRRDSTTTEQAAGMRPAVGALTVLRRQGMVVVMSLGSTTATGAAVRHVTLTDTRQTADAVTKEGDLRPTGGVNGTGPPGTRMNPGAMLTGMNMGTCAEMVDMCSGL